MDLGELYGYRITIIPNSTRHDRSVGGTWLTLRHHLVHVNSAFPAD
jgi:hypothetical protein